MTAVEVARALVERYFPECLAAILGGSIVRGDATPTSDLDLFILTERRDAPYREALEFLGWRCEVFVHSPDSYGAYFISEVQNRQPALLHLCGEGVLLRESGGWGERVQAQARARLAAGPPPLSDWELALYRYRLTDLLEDFEGSTRRDEDVVTASELARLATELILAHHRRWLGRGKWLHRWLATFDPARAARLTDALERFYRDGVKSALIAYAEEALAPVGGRLFAGFRMEGRRSVNRIHVVTNNPWEPVVGYARAVRVGNVIHVSGTTATDETGRIVGVGDPYAQTVRALQNIATALERAGATLKDVVRTRIYVTDISHWEAVGRAHGEFFRDVRPAATLVEVSRLIHPDMLVEIEAEAIVTEKT
ncbi:MAG TPA: Rid family hydrolase [Thermaerobacter sp.]